MFVWWWSKKGGDETLEEGFIDCPRCRDRQPARLVRYVERTRVYFFLTSSVEGAEQVLCLTCGDYFTNHETLAFGPQRNMPDWNCFKCKKPVPNSQVECPHCGFRFAS